jgi:hypothetical protein
MKRNSNGREFSWRLVIKKRQQAMHHKEDDNVKKKRHVTKNIPSPGRNELVSLRRNAPEFI